MSTEKQNKDMAEAISNMDVTQATNVRELLNSAMDLALSNGEISKAEILALKSKFASEIASIDSWLEVNKNKVSKDAQDELKNLKLVMNHRQMENIVPVAAPSKKQDIQKTPEEKIKESIAYNKKHLTQEQVTAVQKVLKVEETGKIDEAFIKDVEAYQSKNDLVKDGKVGEKTLAKMWLKEEKQKETTQKTSQESKIEKPVVQKGKEIKKASPAKPQETQNNKESASTQLNYWELKNAIWNFNDNQKRFLLPEGSTYFGDNVSGDAWSGMSLKKGKEDFRVMVTPDGKFTTLVTTGVEYHDIKEKAKVLKTGTIAMKADQFDFSQVL